MSDRVKCTVCHEMKQTKYCEEYPDTDDVDKNVYICHDCEAVGDEYMKLDITLDRDNKPRKQKWYAERIY